MIRFTKLLRLNWPEGEEVRPVLVAYRKRPHMMTQLDGQITINNFEKFLFIDLWLCELSFHWISENQNIWKKTKNLFARIAGTKVTVRSIVALSDRLIFPVIKGLKLRQAYIKITALVLRGKK